MWKRKKKPIIATDSLMLTAWAQTLARILYSLVIIYYIYIYIRFDHSVRPSIVPHDCLTLSRCLPQNEAIIYWDFKKWMSYIPSNAVDMRRSSMLIECNLAHSADGSDFHNCRNKRIIRIRSTFSHSVNSFAWRQSTSFVKHFDLIVSLTTSVRSIGIVNLHRCCQWIACATAWKP